MVSGFLPFGVSGIKPSTVTAFPLSCVKSDVWVCWLSGTRLNSSFEPDTRSASFWSSETRVPMATITDCFVVNPFFVIAYCSIVTVLPGFKVTVANPLFRLTSTESTPLTLFKATRTAWAQTAQSIPKTVISTRLNSAWAELAISISANTINNFISSSSVLSVLEKEICDVDCHPNSLSG
jgi:hypothetical protein